MELMGRHAGWVTAAAALARRKAGDNPLLIYLPEGDFDMERFAMDVERALGKKNSVVICVSEGLKDERGKFICEYSDEARLDTFGHKMLTGCGKILENFVRDRFGAVSYTHLDVYKRQAPAPGSDNFPETPSWSRYRSSARIFRTAEYTNPLYET